MTNNDKKLSAAIGVVTNMKKILFDMGSKNKPIIDGNRVLNEAYNKLSKKIDDAINRLMHPYLSLATIGTTSAGKSTIVNALAGRKIAPMEAKETSAGMLKLTPSEKRSLKIAKSDYWEYGIFDNLADKEVYRIISEIFEKYFKIKTLVPAPSIEVAGPLLWSKHPELIGLPENLSFQFVDLPGLKTVDDPKNMPVIKSYMAKSVCIVAMDYTDVDNVRIVRLLEELKEIVEALDGNDGSILFLLNKVDRRNIVDAPLREKITSLKTAIETTLPLNKNVEVNIIPFCANLLYLAQSSIGSSFYTDKDIKVDYEQFGALVLEYGKKFEISNVVEEVEAYKRVTHCFGILRDEYDEPIGTKIVSEPNQEDVITLIKAAYRMSHAHRFFDALSLRIEKSFASVVIYPSINELYGAINEFSAKLKTYIGIKKTKNQVGLLIKKISLLKQKLDIIGCVEDENVEKKEGSERLNTVSSFRGQISTIKTRLESIPKAEIEPAQKNILLEELDELSKKIKNGNYEGEIDKKLKEIKEKTSSISSFILSVIEKGGNFEALMTEYFASISSSNNAVSIYESLIKLPTEVKDVLEALILIKIYNSLKNGEGKGALQESLRKQLPEKLVTPILARYESIKDLFKQWKQKGYTDEDEFFTIETNTKWNDEELEKILKDYYNPFNYKVRTLLSKKSNIMFATRSDHFIKGLRQYLKKETSSILSSISFVSKDSAFTTSMRDYIQSAFDEADNIDIQLPDELFEFSTPAYISNHSTTGEYVANGTETYVEEGCCSSTTKTRTKWDWVTKDVYSYSGFLNAQGLYNRWHKGVSDAEHVFWKVLSKWIDESVHNHMELFSSISLKSVDEVDNMINSRIEEKQNTISDSEEHINSLNNLIVSLSNETKLLKFE